MKVFRREYIGRSDHFFELGGDSLLAAVVAAHVHAVMSVELPLRSFGDHPTLAELADDLTQRQASPARESSDRLPARTARSGPLPLSFAQEWVFRECLFGSKPEAWSTVQRHRLTGDVRLDAWEECFRRLVDRHEVFRTTFELLGDRPMATVHEKAEPSWSFVDLREESDPLGAADALVLGFLRHHPFVPQKLPLVRFWLAQVADNEYLLYRAIHHIIVDAWSWRIFFNELARIYPSLAEGKDDALPDAPQYVDYARHQRGVTDVDSPGFLQSVDWWQEYLRRPPGRIRLPLARLRVAGISVPRDGVRELCMPSAVSARLHQLSVHEGATHFSVRFAVLTAALAELTRRRDFVVGTYTTGRKTIELQNTFGMFANLLTIRLRWDPSRSFRHWLRLVSDGIADAREHGEIPYEMLGESLRRRRCRRPVIDTIICTTDRFAPKGFGGLTLSSPQRLVESMPWGLSLSVVLDVRDAWRCEFDARQYDPKLVDIFVDWTENLFGILSSNPDQPLMDLLQDERTALHQSLRSARGRRPLVSFQPVAHGIARLAQLLRRRLAA